MRDSSEDVKSRKYVPCLGYKTNLIFPKTVKIWPKMGTKFFMPANA